MKKLWFILCVLTAVAAGWILYDSMVVGLYFQDRRQGIFLLAAGLGLCALYAWSVHMAGKKRRMSEFETDLMWRGNRRELWMTGVSAGAAAAALGIYCLRYQSLSKIAFCAVLIFGWTIAAACLAPVLKTVRELPEKEFCAQIREGNMKKVMAGESETNQCTLREEELMREMISSLVGIYNDHVVCQVLFCAILILAAVAGTQRFGGKPLFLLLIVLAIPVGFLLLETAKNYRREQILKQLTLWLEEKRPQAALRFLTVYYETAAYRAETLPRHIRDAAAEAMRMQEM